MHRREIDPARVLGAALVLGLSTADAHAGTWVGPLGGNWNNPAHWHDGVVPPAGGEAFIRGNSVIPAHVVFDAFYSSPLNVIVSAGNQAPVTGTVSISQNVTGSQLITPSFFLTGNWGHARYLHSAGTFIVQNQLTIGGGRGFNSAYELSGNAYLSAGSLHVVTSGPDPFPVVAFNQSGGTFLTGSYTANQAIGMRRHTMTGGRMTVAGNVIGIVFNMSGGHLDIGGMLSMDTFNSEGSFTLSGGTLEVATVRADFGFGVTHTGGTARIDHVDLPGPGGYTFNGGSFSAGSMLVGGNQRRFIMGESPSLLARVGAITLNSGGGIDIGRGAVVVDYTGASPLPTIRGYVIDSANGGGTFGAAGIGSRFFNTSTHGVGYAEASDLGGDVPPVFGTVDATAILIRLTRYGDANLDGFVNLTDFNRLATNFGLTSGANWSQGDFNYDGLVNLDDFDRLAANFGLSAAGSSVTPHDWAALAGAVPEPSSVAMLVATTGALLAQRHRGRERRRRAALGSFRSARDVE